VRRSESRRSSGERGAAGAPEIESEDDEIQYLRFEASMREPGAGVRAASVCAGIGEAVAPGLGLRRALDWALVFALSGRRRLRRQQGVNTDFENLQISVL
jgi:hypothetical protein